jgi:hypothetical protein
VNARPNYQPDLGEVLEPVPERSVLVGVAFVDVECEHIAIELGAQLVLG